MVCFLLVEYTDAAAKNNNTEPHTLARNHTLVDMETISCNGVNVHESWVRVVSQLRDIPVSTKRAFFSMTTDPRRISDKFSEVLNHFAHAHFDVEVWSYPCIDGAAALAFTQRFPHIRLVRRRDLVACEVPCSTLLTKFIFAKVLLTPERVDRDRYPYVFLWDDDMALTDSFDANTMLRMLVALNADGGEPALSAGAHFPHQRVEDAHVVLRPPEIMAPAYSASTWNCLRMLIHDPWSWGFPHPAQDCDCHSTGATNYIFSQLRVLHLDTKSDAASSSAVKYEGSLARSTNITRVGCMDTFRAPILPACLKIGNVTNSAHRAKNTPRPIRAASLPWIHEPTIGWWCAR